MIDIAAAGTVSAALRMCVTYIRHLDSLVLTGMGRLYDAHAAKVQMRLAPTKW
jgi:hypothetical protein